jgi:hypothetical protein
MPLQNFQQFSGIHPETASLRNTLAYAGVTAPHTGQPYTEAMLLGIGGGLGAGYILFEFKEHNAKVLVLGFRKEWQYAVRYMQTICDRLNIPAEVLESSGKGAADKHLRETLAAGKPAITWVDKAHLPYYQLPESMKGYTGEIVVVYGVDGDTVLLADLADVGLTVPMAEFVDGRNRIVSYKNRIMRLSPDPNATVDLAAAIRAGIHDCIDNLSGPSDSFSLPTLRKWGRLIVDSKNAKGWRKVFADRLGLYSALRSIYENVIQSGHGGDGLRGLYADFLTEAAPVISIPALNDVAATYRALGAQWVDLAQSALPDSSPVLAEAKPLLDQRYSLLQRHGNAAEAEMQPLSDRLQAMSSQYNRDFPLSDSEVDALFETLSGKLLALYDAEVAAVEQLRAAMQ